MSWLILRSSRWLVKCDCVVLRGPEQCRVDSWHCSTACVCVCVWTARCRRRSSSSRRTSKPGACCPTDKEEEEEKAAANQYFLASLMCGETEEFGRTCKCLFQLSPHPSWMHCMPRQPPTSKWVVPARTRLIINAVWNIAETFMPFAGFLSLAQSPKRTAIAYISWRRHGFCHAPHAWRLFRRVLSSLHRSSRRWFAQACCSILSNRRTGEGSSTGLPVIHVSSHGSSELLMTLDRCEVILRNFQSQIV